MSYYTKHIFICTNQKSGGKQCCADSGGVLFFDYLKERLHAAGLHGPQKIRVSKSGCLGRCSEGPVLVIYPEGVWYTYKTPADIDEIIEHHLLEGHTVKHLLLDN